MRADNYIKLYWDTRESIKADLELIADLKAMTMSLGSIDYTKEKVIGSGYYTGANFETLVNNCQVRIDQIQKRISDHLAALSKIEECLEASDLTQKEKTVINWRFLTHKTIDETADIMFYTPDNIRKIQRKAMEKLEKYDID